jgi:hypothetical protein
MGEIAQSRRIADRGDRRRWGLTLMLDGRKFGDWE